MEKYILQPGQNIFDVAVLVYGHVAGITNLVKDNSISFSSDISAGFELHINNEIDFTQESEVDIKIIESTLAIEIESKSGQNIFDIAIQQYGSVVGIFNIAKLNEISFSQVIEPGVKLLMSDDYINKPIVQYFKTRPVPATGSEVYVGNEPAGEGIGYWIIEENFIIS